MSGMVKGIKSNFFYRIFNVYGPIHKGDKSKTLNELEEIFLLEKDGPSILEGDFNVILNLEKNMMDHK